MILGNASNVPTWTTVSGDLTLSATGTATLASVNANVGSWGGGTAIPVLTVNGKGLVTAASTASITAPAGALTGTTLAANVVTSSLTGLGTITSGTWTGTAVAIGYGGTGQNTALAGFNALSPLTTQGDLIYGGTAGSATRLPVGTSSQALIGGTTPSWGAVNLSTMASGTLQAAQHPALTGAITTTAGSLATTLSAAAVALSNMASLAANSLIGNATGSPATPAAVPIGTGVATALGNAVNGAGGAVLYSGQLGTPTQGVLSACTGYAAGSLTGLGTGVSTALGLAVSGSSGIVLATGPTVSGATLSGTTTISNAPILSALTGFFDSNALVFGGDGIDHVAFHGAGDERERDADGCAERVEHHVHPGAPSGEQFARVLFERTTAAARGVVRLGHNFGRDRDDGLCPGLGRLRVGQLLLLRSRTMQINLDENPA